MVLRRFFLAVFIGVFVVGLCGCWLKNFFKECWWFVFWFWRGGFLNN